MNNAKMFFFPEEGLLKLQEKILCKFGFIPYRNPNASSPPQYVHVSGSMFIMLPVKAKENKKVNGKQFAMSVCIFMKISCLLSFLILLKAL